MGQFDSWTTNQPVSENWEISHTGVQCTLQLGKTVNVQYTENTHGKRQRDTFATKEESKA